MLGILLVDKPEGISSHDVVNTIRRKFSVRRVGHAGTLDPLASGLLLVAVGPATRFLQYLPLEPKEYLAEIAFGVSTTTQDREGQVLDTAEPPLNLVAELERVKPEFTGLIQQIPPMYSAVKKGGKALYVYARKGEDVEREPRTVHIGAVDVLALDGATATCRIECSGGTYVRTLAHDLGAAVGCGAHLAGLRRTRVGRFRLEDALPLDGVEVKDLIPLRDALPPVPLIPLTSGQTDDIRHGRAVTVEHLLSSAVAALLGPHGEVVGMARVHGNVLQPECVIPGEAMHGQL